MVNKDDITYFAEADFRNKKTRFGIKRGDRPRHMYVIGKTGMGKSTLLENMAIQDIQNGEGLVVMDPHGAMAEKLLDYVPEHRIKDVIYFAPFDSSNPIAFNVMEDVGPDKRHLVASGLMSAFKKIWVDAWSARMEYILSNTILALLEYPDATLLGVNRMLSDKEYRKKVVDNISDASVRSFWVDEFAKYTERFAAEATPAIQNKVGQFTSNPIIRNIIGQPHSSFDVRKLMDEKKILIVNLSKGQLGEQNANLLGSMLITKIYLGAMSRADLSAEELSKLPDFYLYIDEFQSFANEAFADILSESRKYKLNLIIAHQYVEQMPEEVQAAVFGNVGTTIAFRVGPLDAELLEKVFTPTFLIEDLINLGFAQIYLSLMVDGVGSKPFSAQTIPPIKPPDKSFKEEIIANTRATYAHPRTGVEENIGEWHKKSVESPKISRPEQLPKKEFFEKKILGGNPPGRKEIRQETLRETIGEIKKEVLKPTVDQSPKKENYHQSSSYLAPKKEKSQHISLNYLSHNKKKEPSIENKLVLKEALLKAMAGRKEIPPIVKVSTPLSSPPSPNTEARKEIPEDVLRKVLE
ncbi:MAG: hypothetical protein A2648_00875 [Candidatus Lloydbacteria bacterium RIFCSPHIGHO2_01_FULL_41_20]|uniref:Type IV secretion system coupling protein TraD DNA-binding domain-containing protein n=1 Tax=Candidatus Lloydbacteria bacterium RIFCSPHIGHO2_01_FULL_41_20 TaxID=1798657 RepID=A0A1G2CTC8_9BACT|nr:MAG: hypothetical protein A2648_00875 [Candidatus Lloydbacteria bacterium RIFCSPHIGHO2_01_FULL_41_20]